MGFEAESEAVALTPAQEAELKALVLARAPEELAAVSAAKTEVELFYALPGAAIAAFYVGDLSQAKQFAEKAIALASKYPKNWNFGNAIHMGHTVLGLLALRHGDQSLAVRELNEAGATPGSPQLDSFGPTMQLARELLRAGESEAVLAYLGQCRSFWKMGTVWLDLWEEKIRSGTIPNCFMHSYR